MILIGGCLMYDKGWIYRVGVMCLCAAVGSYILYTCLSSRDSAPAGDNGERPAQQVNRATELNQQAGAAVKSAAGAVERAEQRAESAAAANQSAQARAADCKKLVDKLQSDNQRAKQIIDELIRGAQTGAAQDAAH